VRRIGVRREGKGARGWEREWVTTTAAGAGAVEVEERREKRERGGERAGGHDMTVGTARRRIWARGTYV
jgi:hypothetical protein